MSLPVKIAYLEISPRQTGKTTRLCQFANELSAAGLVVIYVCLPNLAPGLRVEMPNVIVLADSHSVPDTVDQESAVWIYDEFDWLKTTIVRRGGYYATTVAHLRDLGAPKPGDMLMKLVEANDYRVERHLWSFEMSDLVTRARGEMSAKAFRRMMLGEFLS